MKKITKEEFLERASRKGDEYYRGSLESEIEAARAYNEKAVELFGEFAYLNKV